jgi:hypothetical protein
MDVQIGNVYILKDKAGQTIGTARITSLRGDVVLGILQEGEEFGKYRELFQKHEEAVNQQLFTIADEIEDEIDVIGPKLHSIESGSSIRVYDLQIMNVRNVSFRLSPVSPLPESDPERATS